MKDVIRLDTALCQRQARTQFLTLIRNSEEPFFLGHNQKALDHCAMWIQWVVTRKAKLSGVAVNQQIKNVSPELLAELFAHTGSTLTFLHIESSDGVEQLLHLAAAHCGILLHTLHVHSCTPPASLCAVLQKLTCLENLTLDFHSPQGLTVDHVAGLVLPSLRKLEVRGQASTDAFSALSQAAPHVTHLTICYPHQRKPWTTCMDVRDIGNFGPSLRVLCLLSFDNMRGDDLLFILDSCPNINDITLEDCTRISHVGIVAMAARLNHLHALTVRGLENLSFDTVLSLVQLRGQSLRTLRIVQSTPLSADSIRAIAQHCTELHCITLNGNSYSLLEGLDELFPACRQLRVIDIRCAVLPPGTLQAIADNCPHLHTFLVLMCILHVPNDEQRDMCLRKVMHSATELRHLCVEKVSKLVSAQLQQEWRMLRPRLQITDSWMQLESLTGERL